MTVRKRASKMTKARKKRYRDAITQLIASGAYGQLVSHHANMMHNMHGSMGPTGWNRFLPWHRVYLLKMEQAMQAVEPLAFIPYWDWTTQRRIPPWLEDFMPTVNVPGQGNLSVSRNIGWPPKLPSKAEIADVMDEETYWDFTTALEFQHNGVHVWVGGTMSLITTSPADPLFWLRHAQIDRHWSIWQQSNSGKNPSLSGSDRTMDPWSETEQDVRSINGLRYSYGS